MRSPRKAAGLILALWLSIGTTACNRDKPTPTVLFDEAHGQRFVVEKDRPLDLSRLAAVFEKGGFLVKTNKEELSDQSLADVKALVISGPFSPLAPSEVDAVTRFLEQGGRVTVMLHIGPPLAELLHRLGVSISNGVIQEREQLIDDKPLDFRVVRLKPHPLTKDLKAFGVFGGWALLNTGNNTEIVAQTSPSAWIDLSGDRTLGEGDAVQSFGVIVTGQLGQGRFAIFGDDAIFQNQFLKDGNAVLARNLASWFGAQ